MHIPVILGAILLGPLAGAILGGVFGICSMISNTMAPTLLSFAFSPFISVSVSGVSGIWKSLWICLGCRILIGVISGWLWIFLQRLKTPSYVALPLTGFVGSMTNTAFVMGSIYKLFAGEYAGAKGVAVDAVWDLIMVTVTSSGIPEAIAAAVLVALIGKVLLTVVRRLN